MKYAAAIHYGTAGVVPGVRCFGDEASARKRVSRTAEKGFMAQIAELEHQATLRCYELEAGARELADSVRASFHSEASAIRSTVVAPADETEADVSDALAASVAAASVARDSALSVIASDLSAQVRAIADELAAAITPIVEQRNAAVQAALATLHKVGEGDDATWVVWPESAGAFPSQEQIGVWADDLEVLNDVLAEQSQADEVIAQVMREAVLAKIRAEGELAAKAWLLSRITGV